MADRENITDIPTKSKTSVINEESRDGIETDQTVNDGQEDVVNLESSSEASSKTNNNDPKNHKHKNSRKKRKTSKPMVWLHTFLMLHAYLLGALITGSEAVNMHGNLKKAGWEDCSTNNSENSSNKHEHTDNTSTRKSNVPDLANLVRIGQLGQEQVIKRLATNNEITYQNLVNDTTEVISRDYPRLWGDDNKNQQTTNIMKHFIDHSIKQYPQERGNEKHKDEEIDWPKPPDPKTFHLISANVTSSQSNADITMSWKAEAVALHEVKLDLQGQVSYTAEATKRSWSVQHGKPLVRQRTASGANQVKQGGILTQARNPARIATTHIGYTQEEQELYDSQRHVTARVPVNAGKVDGNKNVPEALVVENSYCGQSKDRESTLYCNRYLRTLFHVAGSRGELPVAICIDTNLPYKTHAIFQQLMAEGEWVDAAVLQQAQDGKPIEPTYSLNSNFEDKTAGNITTIDAILLNRTAAQLFQKFWLTETAGITSHKQLHLNLNMAHYTSPIDVLQIPKPFPIADIQPMDEESQDRLANAVLDKYAPDINKEYENKHPEQINSSKKFQLICKCWEEYLTHRLRGATIKNSMKGRGGKPERKETTLAAVAQLQARRYWKRTHN